MLSEVRVHTTQLPLFNTLALEINAKCNRVCDFCPQAKSTRPSQQMTEEIISDVIDQLIELKFKKRVSLNIYNEPLRHKGLEQFISMFTEKLPKVCTMFATNADYLKRPEDLAKFFNAGCRQIQINIYSNEKRYQQLKKWVDELGYDQDSSVYTYAKPGQKICQVLRKFDDKFEGGFTINNRAGNIPWFQAPIAQPLQKMCTRPWRMLNINWDGQAILCCNDYEGETNFGNLKTHSLLEMWNHMEFHKIRERLQNKDRNLPVCGVCDYGGGSYPHMIHPVNLIPYTNYDPRRLDQ